MTSRQLDEETVQAVAEVLRGAGGLLRDRDGVRFMNEVHPSAELAPRDVVSRAILDRMVATGRPPALGRRTPPPRRRAPPAPGTSRAGARSGPGRARAPRSGNSPQLPYEKCSWDFY